MARTSANESSMSDAHKAALVAGRNEARVVREYLVAIKNHRPKPGRKRTLESVRSRLEVIESELRRLDAENEDPIRYLELLQERIDLNAEIEQMQSASSVESLEREFVEVAGHFAARKGISYGAWRQMGVSAATLRRAGIQP